MSGDDILQAPAPWQLRGDAWIAALSMPTDELDRTDFLPSALHGKRLPGRTALLMLVDYRYSDVGPYRELLFIPGRFRFPNGGTWPSISRILVSTDESVVNGRQNWGIPKERADFQVTDGPGGRQEWTISLQGRQLARLAFRRYPLPLPAPGGLLPSRFRTLGQHRDGHSYTFAPLARGTLRPARMTSASADPGLFPDITRGKPLATMSLSGFRMTFPEARVFRDTE